MNEGLKGQDGLELKEYWESLKGPEAYLGLAVPNVSSSSLAALVATAHASRIKFPNVFIVLGPNASAGFWGYSAGNQSAVISRIIKEVR